VTGEDGRPDFVTVDDLDSKDWMGDTRQAAFEGLRRALATAAALRYEADLEFVVPAVAARDGELVRRLDDRYAVSVFPFLAGHSYPFGRYGDARLRGQALDMIAALPSYPAPRVWPGSSQVSTTWPWPRSRPGRIRSSPTANRTRPTSCWWTVACC
jgi:spectinomycin phosphotransferase